MIKVKSNTLLFLVLLIIVFSDAPLRAQNDTIKYQVGITGLGSTGSSIPFWLHSNKYGQYSTDSASANLWIGIEKDYSNKNKLIDFGFKINALLQTSVSGTNTAYLHESYIKTKFSFLSLIAGRKEEIIGNQDSTLSCGGFLFSTNARPIPKVTAGILNFVTLPYTFGLLEVKGALSHGWFSKQAYEKGAYLHHKYLYVRLGGKSPVKVQYGLDHVGVWGGTIPYENIGYQPFTWANFKNVFLVRAGGAGGESINALGNHIISQSMKIEAKVYQLELSAYWQNLSEDGPVKIMWNSMNVPDGLWGLSIKTTHFPFVKKVLYEYLNTTDQSGPYHDKDGIIYGGSDGYFSNYVYNSGWTYFNRVIGTPLISSPTFNNIGQLVTLNNKVSAHHIGIEGDISDFQYKMLASFSKNYGGVGLEFPNRKNTSLLLEVNKIFPKFSRLEAGISIASDFGQLTPETWGVLMSIRKRGDLFVLKKTNKNKSSYKQ